MNKSLPNLFNSSKNFNIQSLHNVFKLKTNYIKNKNAFTLIELLIVIVIITVLVGIMVTIIDPLGQQNKAEDAVILASLNKIILSTNSHTSAYGYAPTGTQLVSSLSNSIPLSNFCDDKSCLFKIDSVYLPNNCDTTNYLGDGNQECYFYYEKIVDSNSNLRRSRDYRLYVKNFGTQEIIVYDSTIQKIQLCSNDFNLSNCNDL